MLGTVLPVVQLLAQTNSKPLPDLPVVYKPGRVTIVPGPHFAAGGFHRFLFGNTWRALWTRPVSVRVLDLSRTAGGLTAESRGEGHASRPFLLVASDGRVFGYRAFVKDAVLDWPEDRQTETLRHLGADQVSGSVPAGALVVTEIERATGAGSLNVWLVALPDDQRLGRWRPGFAGGAGILERRLRPWEEATDPPAGNESIATDSLFVLLRTDPASEVDARAFLTNRLVDILVGDWDRYAGQWSWMERQQGPIRWWTPISSDRDWAFNHLDGLVWGLIRKLQPKFQVFDDRINGLSGLLIMSRGLDRRLFASLDKAAWDSVTRSVVERLSDHVLERAVAALPPGMDSTGVRHLESTLRVRRDHLAQASAEFYRRLADVVEVWATEGTDRVEITEGSRGGVVLTLDRGADGHASWSREFVPDETREVRVYLLAGNDRVTGKWEGGPVRIRLIHEGDGKLQVDPSVTGVDVHQSREPFQLPEKRFDPERVFRDWGGTLAFSPWVGQKSGAGIILGGGPVLTRYAFRRVPYAYRVTVRAAFGTTGTVNFQSKGDFRFASPGTGIRFDAKALQADAIHYFGFGNETVRTETGDFYMLRQHTYQFGPLLYQEFGKRGLLSVGPFLSHTTSALDRASLARNEQPYGFGSFTEFGAVANALLDLRDDPVYPIRGFKAEVNGRYFPAWGDVQESFGVVTGELDGYLGTRAIPGTPVIAVRGGGAHGFGSLPFFEAPTLGGKPSLRGFSRERYHGNGSLYGSAELRFNLGHFKAMVPGEIGVYGLGDIGRVYQSGAASSLWHKDYGAGIWLSFVERRTTLNLSLAHSSDGTKFYLAAGFHF